MTGLAYCEELNPIQTAIVEEGIMPVTVPILEKNTIQLIVHATIRSAEVNGHQFRRVRMNEETMNAPCLDRNLTILWQDLSDLTVYFNSHDTGFNLEILGLKLVEMQQWSTRPFRTIDQSSQILRDWALCRMPIGLAEQKASSGWRFKKLGSEQSAKSIAFVNFQV